MKYEAGKTYFIKTDYRVLNGPARQEFNRKWGPVAEEYGCTFEPLRRGQEPPRPEQPQPTDLNTANADELQQLDGIGPEVAQAIIDRREQEPFTDVDQLADIPGIGAKTVKRLRGLVAV